MVLGRGCKLSMDRQVAWRENVFVERLWRSVKYECVYLKAYDSVTKTSGPNGLEAVGRANATAKALGEAFRKWGDLTSGAD